MVAAGTTAGSGDASASWRAVTAAPHPALAGVVRGYGGFEESSPRPVLRRELPAADVVLVLDLTQNLEVRRSSVPCRSAAGIVAGPGRTAVSTCHPGQHAALEVRMSALGARSLLGVPGGELSEQVLDLGALWGRAAGELAERVSAHLPWSARFALLDEALVRRWREARDTDPVLLAAHRLLLDREGDVPMRELLELTGWSRRRLASRFHAEAGMTPKVLARLARFRRAERLLRAPGRRSLASVALTCGYYDQAHLNRDFREFAGCTPTAHLARLRADPAAADTVAPGPGAGNPPGPGRTDVQDLPGGRS